jgi:hypothetical protein
VISTRQEDVQVREHFLQEKRSAFLKAALDGGLVNQQEGVVIQNVWKLGDFAMHIHQKLDMNRKEFSNLSRHNLGDSVLKGWSNRSEALTALSNMATILSNIMKRLNLLVT